MLREAWARTEGIKAIMVGGLLLIYAAIVAATWVLGQVFGVEDETLDGATRQELKLRAWAEQVKARQQPGGAVARGCWHHWTQRCRVTFDGCHICW